MKEGHNWLERVKDKKFEALKQYVTSENVNQPDKDGLYPLYYAIALKQPKCFVHLLKHCKADPNIVIQPDAGFRPEEYHFPLHETSGIPDYDYDAKNDLWRYALLLIQCKANIEARNHRGQTPLFRAIEEGKPRVASILLEHKADICALPPDCTNMLRAVGYETPREQHFKCMRLILLAGGALTSKDEREYYDDRILEMQRPLARCKLACVAARRALRKQGKIHRDVISIVERMIWDTKDFHSWKMTKK